LRGSKLREFFAAGDCNHELDASRFGQGLAAAFAELVSGSPGAFTRSPGCELVAFREWI
jgi:hypothetical protein